MRARKPLFVLTNGGSRRPPFRSVDAVIHHADDLCRVAQVAEPNALHFFIPCPVSVPTWDEVTRARQSAGVMRAQLGIPRERFVFIAVGAIDRHTKRVDYIATELSFVADELDLHLLLLGQVSKDNRRLLAYVRSVLPERVTVRVVPPSHVSRYLAAADVHVSASLNEGFGRVFVEAQAAGTINVVHDSPRTRTILQDHGVFTDMSARGALATTALAVVQSGDLREGSRNGWVLASELDWKRLGPRYSAALRTIAANSS